MPTTQPPASGTNPWFRQAIDMLQASMKTGLQFQDESTRRVSDMLAEFTPPQDWRKASQEFLDEVIQVSQLSFDKTIGVMNQNTRTALELLQKTMEAMPGSSTEQSQAKIHDLTEATLAAMRTNTQAAVQANSQMVEAWAAFAKRMAGQRIVENGS